MARSRYKTLKEANKALPSETAEVFEIVEFSKRTSYRFYSSEARAIINLKTLSIQNAEHLVKKGVSFIKRKENESN